MLKVRPIQFSFLVLGLVSAFNPSASAEPVDSKRCRHLLDPFDIEATSLGKPHDQVAIDLANAGLGKKRSERELWDYLYSVEATSLGQPHDQVGIDLANAGIRRTSTMSNVNSYTQLHNQARNTIYQNYPEAMVRVAHVVLSALLNDNPIAFYEYVQLCRNPEHEMLGKTGEYLAAKSTQLVRFDGRRYRAERQFRELTLALVNDQDSESMELLRPPRVP